MKKPIVELEKVSFSYGCHPVLNNISLAIDPGEAVGLVGPNGSGKTTLLKLILGQLKPQGGRVHILGEEAHRLRQRHRVGYVSQRATHFNNDFPATLREVVASGRVAGRGLFRPLLRTDYAAVDRALEMVGLKEYQNQPVGCLSGGQQQRMCIARALVAEPVILVLDEPTVGIDAAAVAAFCDLLRSLNRGQGLTLLIVSHELEELSPLITRQLHLNGQPCDCSCHSYTSPQLQQQKCVKGL